jgi:hypothetical protein
MYTGMGTLVTETSHVLHGTPIPRIGPGDGYLDVEIETMNLLPDRYALSLWITDRAGQLVYDGDVRTVLEVEPTNVYRSGRMPSNRQGIVYFPQRWRLPVSAPNVGRVA